MTDAEHLGEKPVAFDITKAGPLTLHNRGISFAVDELVTILRYADGTPIDGHQIEDTINGSGRRLTNAAAAGRLIAAQEFTDGIRSRLDEFQVINPSVDATTDHSPIVPGHES